jgi:hypothetical protein
LKRSIKNPPKQKKAASTAVANPKRPLRERISADGIEMDACLTPHGTLTFKCRRNDHEDDFFDDFYGADDDDEVDHVS